MKVTVDRVGLFCWPENEADKKQLMEKSGLNDKYQFLGFYDSMWNSLWMSVVLGAVYLVVVQCFPTTVVPWLTLLGGFIFVLLGVFALMYLLYHLDYLKGLL